MKIRINNAFHGTSKIVILEEGKNIVSSRRLREWKKALCCSDCQCSGVTGTRSDRDNGIRAFEIPDGWEIESFFLHDRKGLQIMALYLNKIEN